MFQMIKAYFQAWINNDCSKLRDLFHENIIYSECYGPEYFGIEQVLQWFQDWNKNGIVHIWEIKQFIEQDKVCVVEWYFECEYQKELSGFDGVSIIEFDENNKIIHVKEFQSQKEHNYPYGKKQ